MDPEIELRMERAAKEKIMDYAQHPLVERKEK